MNFRTELTPDPSGKKITLQDRIFTIGSCFSDTMGDKFRGNKFNVLPNPFGTVYHPRAIHKLLMLSALNLRADEANFLERDGIYFNYDFHSGFHSHSKETLRSTINESLTHAHEFLKQVDTLIITYGTAWYYERNDSGSLVANCHKMPSSSFSKKLSSPEEIEDSFNAIYRTLIAMNPEIQIIITVSPVRHLKDSIELNQVSKSILRLACHRISEARDHVDYFPAYEIMMDDLRDYRFYEPDLIHPTAFAEEYIWERFSECYFQPDTKNILNRWKDIRKALEHKPFQTGSISHQKFLQETLTRLTEIKSIIDVHSEIEKINSQISEK